MVGLLIRPPTIDDHRGIARLVSAAFEQDDEADLVARLRAEGQAAIELVAVDRDLVVGHVLFSPMAAPFRALGLAPLAVCRDRRRRGIGSILVQDGLDRAAADGWQGVFVVGDPDYYGRFGFSAALASGFVSPYAGPHLMVLPLNGPLPATTGPVAYAPAFDALG